MQRDNSYQKITLSLQEAGKDLSREVCVAQLTDVVTSLELQKPPGLSTIGCEPAVLWENKLSKGLTYCSVYSLSLCRICKGEGFLKGEKYCS